MNWGEGLYQTYRLVFQKIVDLRAAICHNNKATRMTNITTHLRKMRTELTASHDADYFLPQIHILSYSGEVGVNAWLGKMVRIEFTGNIHCIVTGKAIKKTYGEGLSYDAWLSSPLGNPAIVHPELSRIHEGIALRDKEWEEKHHNQPHYVYLSRTSGVKVGVTRSTNLYSRWIDQGATEGIIVAHTPYRQLAGLIEVALKNHMADKTAWQAMLKGECNDNVPLTVHKDKILHLLPADFEDFFSDDDTEHSINYPIIHLPIKPKSLKLDTSPIINKRLVGIKGQYFIFDDDSVLNIRAHSAYEVTIGVE